MSGGTRLELAERERLAALRAEGLSLRAIARALGRAASTISRELRRNALPRGGWLPAGARRGLLPRTPAAPGRPGARRQARPLRPRAPAGGLDARADRRLAEARRGARARPGVARDDLRLRPSSRAEGREALEA